MLLCGGDGLADIVGRRLGRAKLPGQRDKSWAGSIAFFGGGAALALLYLAFFDELGALSLDIRSALFPLLGTALTAAAVEGYTPAELDNLTVPVAALTVLWLLIPVLGWWQIPFLA